MDASLHADAGRELIRERCKTDLFFLAKRVLGYNDLTSSIHKPLCHIVQMINGYVVPKCYGVTKCTPSMLSTSDPMSPYAPVKVINTKVASVQVMDASVKTGININDPVVNRQKREQSLTIVEPVVGATPTPSSIRHPLPPSPQLLVTSVVGNTNSSGAGSGTADLGQLAAYARIEPEALTRLFLLFRGAFKSTIITIAHTIQLMLLWPDIRILIASHKKEGGSQKFLAAIKHHFLRNSNFRLLFPEYCPKANSAGVIEWGTQDAVTLPNRSETAAFPEETIEIASSTSNVTGRHYNYIKVDDIVTVDSVTNELMLERTEEFNALLKFLFDNPERGVTDYIGTTYHFADLYSVLRESSKVTKVILPCWNEEEEPTIPERFTHDGLQAIKDDPLMTSYQWSAQYMLNPVPEVDQTFRPEWWRRADFYYDVEPRNLRVAVFVDPASKQRKESDYTALISVGIDSKGEFYLLDIIRDKLTVDGRAQLVLDVLKKRGIHKVHYETIGFQNTDLKTIKELGVRRDWHVTVEEIKASRQSKEDRIRGLQGVYEQGHMHWPRHYDYFSKYHHKLFDMVDLLRREMWMFPKIKFFDLSDCHSFMLRASLYKPSDPRGPAEDDRFEWWRQRAIESKRKQYKPMNGKAAVAIPAQVAPPA